MRRLAMATALGAGLLIAGCGSASTVTAVSPPASTSAGTPEVVDVACRDGASAALTVGEAVQVTGCGAGTTAAIAPVAGEPSAVLIDDTSHDANPTSFTAVRSGRAVISLSDAPACSPGMLCPDFRRFDGTISVTVTAA